MVARKEYQNKGQHTITKALWLRDETQHEALLHEIPLRVLNLHLPKKRIMKFLNVSIFVWF